MGIEPPYKIKALLYLKIKPQIRNILINALNHLIIKENDINDYSSIFNKLQGELSLLDDLKEGSKC